VTDVCWYSTAGIIQHLTATTKQDQTIIKAITQGYMAANCHDDIQIWSLPSQSKNAMLMLMIF
jgi:hypothetical protein